jgi:hypothetical protein
MLFEKLNLAMVCLENDIIFKPSKVMEMVKSVLRMVGPKPLTALSRPKLPL